MLLAAACTDPVGEITRDSQPFDSVAPSAAITAVGTEPFWDLEVGPSEDGYEANFSSADTQDSTRFAVTRFAGNNGLGFSGEWRDGVFSLALTPGDCSDGMSDRSYPYTATVLLGEVTLYGCGYTDDEPFVESEGG